MIKEFDSKLDLVDVLLLVGMVFACIYMAGCGYALVKIHNEPGQRTQIWTDQNIQSAFGTAIETAIEPSPASFFKGRRKN